jgi:hypothetical protein
MGITINAAGLFLNSNGQVTTYTAAQLVGWGLPANQAHWSAAQWQQYIDHEWAASHPRDKNGGPPPNQTITVVTTGDCQWNIATGDGANPVKTAYSMNPQFSNPDLIYPGNIEFVAPTTTYGVSANPTSPSGGVDNTAIFGNATFLDAALHGEGDGNLTGVTASVYKYLQSLPKDPNQRRSALINLLLLTNWASDSAGYSGRQIIIQQYLQIMVKAGVNLKTAVTDLKDMLGLPTAEPTIYNGKLTPGGPIPGTPTYSPAIQNQIVTTLENRGVNSDDAKLAASNAANLAAQIDSTAAMM